MIPRLKVSEFFYKEICEELTKEEVQLWKNIETPYDNFADNSFPVYQKNVECYVGKHWLWDEYKNTTWDVSGYCTSEWALKTYLHPFIESETKYMVTARLVKFDVAEDDESVLMGFINEEGEDTDMRFCDYVDEYGYPKTQYENMVIMFDVFILNEYE